MTIKQKLIIAGFLPIAFLLVLGIVQLQAARSIDRANLRADVADDITTELAELVILTQEAAASSSRESRQLWFAKYQATHRLLSRVDGTFGSPEELQVVEHILRDFSVIGARFTEATSPAVDGRERKVAQELTEVFRALRDIIPSVDRLHDLNHVFVANAVATRDRLSFVFLVSLALSIPAIMILIFRGLSRPIDRLLNGIAIVSAGDLGHRVGIRSRDEIGQLAQSFDEMAEERQRVEVTLRLNQDRLATLHRLSQMITEPEEAIKDFALEEGVRLTGSRIGYIFFLNEDETVLSLYAWSKNVMAQCAVAQAETEFQVAEAGTWAEAVRLRRPIICNDYAAEDPRKRGTPDGHVPIIRHMSLPLIDNGRIVLLAGVGNKEEGYCDEDIRQLTLIMDTMWRLVQKKRADERLCKINQELEQRVRERTAELSRAKDDAEQSSRAKSANMGRAHSGLKTDPARCSSDCRRRSR